MPDYDPQIKHAFEVADDSLQGVLGYHYFTLSLKHKDQLKHFPDGIGFVLSRENDQGAFLHTISWERHFSASEFIDEMSHLFEEYESRVSLVFMTNVFSALLSNFITILEEKGLLDPVTITVIEKEKPKKRYINGRTNYKDSLNWAYQIVKKCSIGDPKAIERLPKTLGIIDNARRLRNRIVHNNGLFKESYEKDTIKDPEGRELFEVQTHPGYYIFKKNTDENIPIILKPYEIVDFSRSHVEVLHVLHNSIQENFFKCTEPYDYRKEGKRVEWTRILRGA
jgi:hypothetical protein